MTTYFDRPPVLTMGYSSNNTCWKGKISISRTEYFVFGRPFSSSWSFNKTMRDEFL